MRKYLHWMLVLTVGALAWGATPAKKKGSAKAPAKTGTKTASSKTPSTKSGATKSTAARSKNAKGTGRPATTWRNRQLAPTPDRYREIQGALAAKGYLDPASTSGTWDEASVDALKRFQADQKIVSTGKINSLSLIALGLGPKHGPAPTETSEPKQ